MRYSIIGAEVHEIEEVGGTNVKGCAKLNMVFADLTEEQADQFEDLGYQVDRIGKVDAAIAPPTPIAGEALYTPGQLIALTGIDRARAITDPPLYGNNLNIAILDTGIRETHELIYGRVLYSKNFTSSPMRDGFNHGTAVASVIAGVAPLCGILNLKVLDDDGAGTEEEVVLAIDECLSLRETNPNVAPMVINLSLGSVDDGNPNNPMRAACRMAVAQGIFVVAAAGNLGPDQGTIMSPACERYVGAVGSAKPEPFEVSWFSSRGPTLEGIVKPDAVLFGENISLASSKSDTATIAKSGTSFAAPFGSCIILLSQEGIIRRAAYPEGVPAGLDPTQTEMFTPEDLMDKWQPRIGIKPQGVAAGKDNDYGWGLPLGDLIISLLQPAFDVSGLLNMMMMVMMMGVMARTMK